MDIFSLLKNSKRNKGVKTLMKNYYKDEAVQCVICLEETQVKSLVTPCFHQFCQFCLFQWINVRRFCPVCRQNINKVVYNIVSNITYDDFSIHTHNNYTYGELHPVNNDKLYRNSKIFIAVLENIKQFIENNHPNEMQIKLNHFTKALNSSVNLRLTSHFMRCFIYTYDKWKFEKKFGKLRLVSLEFFRDNPMLINRLLEFTNFELRSLEFMTKIKVNSNFIEDLSSMLRCYCLKSKRFMETTKALVNKYYPEYNDFNFATKFHRELLCFASSEVTDVEDYINNSVYSRVQESVIQVEDSVCSAQVVANQVSVITRNEVIVIDDSVTTETPPPSQEQSSNSNNPVDVILVDSGSDSDVKIVDEGL